MDAFTLNAAAAVLDVMPLFSSASRRGLAGTLHRGALTVVVTVALVQAGGWSTSASAAPAPAKSSKKTKKTKKDARKKPEQTKNGKDAKKKREQTKNGKDAKNAPRKRTGKKQTQNNKTQGKEASTAPSDATVDPPAPSDTNAVPVPDASLSAAASAAALPPVPVFHSFRTGNTFDGKVGASVFYAKTHPFGSSTGFANFFAAIDYDGIGNSGFGLHADFEVRTAGSYLPIFERRDTTLVGTKGETFGNGVSDTTNPNARFERTTDREGKPLDPAPGPAQLDPAQAPAATSFAAGDAYRRPGTFVTGHTYDYLRIDRLNFTWDTDAFGLTFGRMLLPLAAQAQTDGLELHFGKGLFRGGVFGGLKPNPWHQQVVGAASGGFIVDPVTRDYTQVQWSTFIPDRDFSFQGGTTGAYSNELPGQYPWITFLTVRTQTFGGYGSLRGKHFFIDGALVVDTFLNDKTDNAIKNGPPGGFQIDRIWGHTSFGLRLLDHLTLAGRTSIDLVGTSPLHPRDVFLDLTWRQLGPLTLSTSYSKVNTYSTAASYFRFFRPLEDPNNLRADLIATSFGGSADGVTDDLKKTGLNNTSLFVVDRDRFKSEAALKLTDSLELFGDIVFERRNDHVTTYASIGDSYGAIGDGFTNLGNRFSCQDLENPTGDGINATVPVNVDRCKIGGAIGLRDPFLGRNGSFDLKLSHMNGYLQRTTALTGNLGVTLFDRAYLSVGGAAEMNANSRVFGLFNPNPQPGTAGGTAAFFPVNLNVYSAFFSGSVRILGGLSLEASYSASLEELPFQGSPNPGGSGDPFPVDESQFTQAFFSRAVWRF